MKAALLLVLTLALAAPPPPQPTAPTAKKATPAQPSPKISLPPPLPLKPPVDEALGLCRAACSRAYYLCLQQNDADLCDPAWTQCRADCARASATP